MDTRLGLKLIDYVLYYLGFRIEGGCHTTRGNMILCRIIRVSRGIEIFNKKIHLKFGAKSRTLLVLHPLLEGYEARNRAR